MNRAFGWSWSGCFITALRQPLRDVVRLDHRLEHLVAALLGELGLTVGLYVVGDWGSPASSDIWARLSFYTGLLKNISAAAPTPTACSPLVVPYGTLFR